MIFFLEILKEIWIPNCENHPGLPGCPLRFHWPGVIDPAGCTSCGVSLQVSQHFAAIRTTSNRITQWVRRCASPHAAEFFVDNSLPAPKARYLTVRPTVSVRNCPDRGHGGTMFLICRPAFFTPALVFLTPGPIFWPRVSSKFHLGFLFGLGVSLQFKVSGGLHLGFLLGLF